MKVSLNVIKQLINFELPPVDELVRRINQQLGSVEQVENLAERYRGARGCGWWSALSTPMPTA